MKKYTIGIDFGGTNIKLGLVNSRSKVVARARLETKKYPSQLKLIKAMALVSKQFIKDQKLKKNDVLGVGVGLPGLIDAQNGIVKILPNVPGWRNVKFKQLMEQELKVPVFIDNDVNVIALAEWKYGAGVGVENILCITLGTGLGGGLILNNRIYRGSGFSAGEIGHMPYRDKTIELFVGNAHFMKTAQKVLGKSVKHPQDVAECAKNKDKRSLKLWSEFGEHLGYVLSGVINLLNPRLIIIGGGVANNSRFFMPALKQTIKSKALAQPARMVKIVRAQLKDDAGILGARILVKEELARV